MRKARFVTHSHTRKTTIPASDPYNRS